MRLITLSALAVAGTRSGLRGGESRKIDVRAHKNKMEVYSAIKIKANFRLLYSVLKPDTNSLSPSVKSNGARLASASITANHITERGGAKKIIVNWAFSTTSKRSKV